jgi:bifunctional DNA-binding transcriptional regulator/antitoxin component of YhaV-PrlF toxin-antitoxin module
MVNKVGPKGQVVIEKEIRDRLGVEQGWLTLQHVSGDHVEVHFIPPEHRQSLKGSLAKHTKDTVQVTDWHKATEKAWRTEAVLKTKRGEK